MSNLAQRPPNIRHALHQARPRLTSELQPRYLVASVTAGLSAGLVTLVLSVSFAALIFSGDLAPYLPLGIGFSLFGAVALNLAATLGSPTPSVVAGPQDAIAAIVAGAVSAMAGVLAAQGLHSQILPTTIAAITLSSLLVGLVFLALGLFRLGRLIRFIPYPVIGGFLAGTGWLLAVGAVRVMSGLPLQLGTLHLLAQGDILLRLIPGVVLGVLLLVLLRRYQHAMLMPGLLLSALALFFAALWLTHTSLAEASALGLLIGPFPSDGLWTWRTLDALRQANWAVLAGQAGSFAAVPLIAAIALLLNLTGLELATQRDVNVDRELQVMGLANLVTGAASGLAGYHLLSASLIGPKSGSQSRLVSAVTTLLLVSALWVSATLLGYVPKFLLGGLLLFVGLALLMDWLYDAWFTLPRVDYSLVVLILVVIGAVGFLEGIAVGVVIATILFVITYSRLNVVKHTLSGASYQSNVDRPPAHRQFLQAAGATIHILKLQGFLFFGTSNSLLEQLRRRVEDETLPRLRFIVMDFRLVGGMDSSAVLSLTKLRQLAQARGFQLVFTSLSPEMRQRLALDRDTTGQAAFVRIFPDLDRGVEWCENRLLADEPSPAGATLLLTEELVRRLNSPDAALRLLTYFDTLHVPVGQYLVRQGDPSDALYLIEAGQVTVLLEQATGRPFRLRSMSAGTLIGELGFYLGTPRSASVIADTDTVLYRVTTQALHTMREQDPQLAAIFHELVAQILADRLLYANQTVAALLQ